MHLPFLHHHTEPKPGTEKEALIPVHQPEHNTNEGSEFLDDALRMEDQVPSDNKKSDTTSL